GRPRQGPQRHAGLPLAQAEWLGALHPTERGGSEGDGVDLRALPELQGAVAAARPANVGLWLLGPEPVVVGVGGGDVPATLRDRDHLSAVAPGADSDLHTEPAASVVVCGDRLSAAER